MERLTNKREADAQRKDYENRIKNGYPRNIPEERFLRLAAYEDTKMPPELVEKVAKFAMWVKDCQHLMFSDCYGECTKCHLGIVRPDDSCEFGERRATTHV